MKQMTFASAAWSTKGKTTRRERFLAEMNAVIPWARLVALMQELYGDQAYWGEDHRQHCKHAGIRYRVNRRAKPRHKLTGCDDLFSSESIWLFVAS